MQPNAVLKECQKEKLQESEAGRVEPPPGGGLPYVNVCNVSWKSSPCPDRSQFSYTVPGG